MPHAEGLASVRDQPKIPTYRQVLGQMSDQCFRVLKMSVNDEAIWQFDDQIALVENPPSSLRSVGDTAVEPSNDGFDIYLAVESFHDFPAARAAQGSQWFNSAVAALKATYRAQTPTGILRLYRDPVNGQLRNLAE